MSTKVAPSNHKAKVHHTKLFIDNKWVDPVDGGEFETLNPATGEVQARVAFASPSVVDEAVESAARAAETWRSVSIAKRTKVLFAFRQLVDKFQGELARLFRQAPQDVGPASDERTGPGRCAAAAGKALRRLGDAWLDLLRRQAIEARVQFEVLPDRQLRIEREGLRHVADAAADIHVVGIDLVAK